MRKGKVECRIRNAEFGIESVDGRAIADRPYICIVMQLGT